MSKVKLLQDDVETKQLTMPTAEAWQQESRDRMGEDVRRRDHVCHILHQGTCTLFTMAQGKVPSALPQDTVESKSTLPIAAAHGS